MFGCTFSSATSFFCNTIRTISGYSLIFSTTFLHLNNLNNKEEKLIHFGCSVNAKNENLRDKVGNKVILFVGILITKNQSFFTKTISFNYLTFSPLPSNSYL